MNAREADVIDELTGVAPGSALDEVRRARGAARANAQKSFEALFEPSQPGGVSIVQRFALAAFVAGLHAEPETQRFYVRSLAEAGASPALIGAVEAEVARGAAKGPFGRYPAGRLSVEDFEGALYAPTAESRRALGGRLATAFAHAHLLVLHPRDASRDALRALEAAGWETTEIVTLSQLVAFLTFQIRVVAGLTTLADASR